MRFMLTGSLTAGASITAVTEEAAVIDDPRNAEQLRGADLLDRIRSLEASGARWIWDDTTKWYPPLLRQGVRIDRCVDLRLTHRLLCLSPAVPSGAFDSAADSPWRREADPARPEEPKDRAALFDDLDRVDDVSFAEAHAEYGRQCAALAQSGVADPLAAGKLRLLLAAESGGALIAAEIHHRGLPWSSAEHDLILTRELGPRPRFGGRPEQLANLADRIRHILDAPNLNPDSPPEVLRALGRAGISVPSTSKWVLREIEHPVIEPLLTYKSKSRLLAANGWSWLDTWVQDDRYRPEYVVGGTATGRWATSGGGAMQLPAQIRAAVRADPGWTLVVADAAQLEPRIIAAMSRDEAMASAGRAKDLYNGLVDAGVVATRDQAKIAMLGALYGATSGESGALMPSLRRAFPRAIALVEAAARTGEHGRQVSTWLGRGSPAPGAEWWDAQHRAGQVEATEADRRRAGTQARDWGRFSRNFIAQGTAAEWALCWMAGLRQRLARLGSDQNRAHLVYCLHDEVVVHAPMELAEAAAEAVRESAAEAGRLLFGRFPIDFPLSVSVVERYSDAV